MATTTSYPSSYPSANPNPAGYPKPKANNFVESMCMNFSEPSKKPDHGIKLRYIYNFFKATTVIVILSLMRHYGNYSLGSFLYLGLHGIYGLMWILKDLAFPDRNFDKRVGIFNAMVHFCMLTAYWVLPWLQISGHGVNKPSAERVMVCIMLFATGLTIEIAADAQKTFVLHQKQGLITNGMFRFTRNPNYVGQSLIYASFALATGSVVSWGIISTLWLTILLPTMIAKDVSLRSMDGGSAYFEQSSMLLPRLFFKNTFLHYLSWMAIFGAIFAIGGMVSFTHFLKHPLKSLFH